MAHSFDESGVSVRGESHFKSHAISLFAVNIHGTENLCLVF